MKIKKLSDHVINTPFDHQVTLEMVLVDYSDSEGSSEESKPTEKPALKTGTSSTPTFQKVIDRSNPHKIKVILPEASESDSREEEHKNGPPAKRAKLGGGGFSGFNSMLPAPKRAASVSGGTDTGGRRGGLGSGVSFKTSAAPGFSREPMPTSIVAEEELNGHSGDDGVTLSDTQGISATLGLSKTSEGKVVSSGEPKKIGNPMMFKPLSVARKPQKKKKATTSAQAVQPLPTPKPPPPYNAVTKISLFSVGAAENEELPSLAASGDYEPLLYRPTSTSQPDDALHDINTEDNNMYVSDSYNFDAAPPGTIDAGPQSLSSIASDLNLSASAKRQLFGRQRNNGKGDASAINVVNFNTDQEYAANDLLRQAGEQVQHNPIRALAAGKHSLKQLISAASTQKDALEEHFASGRRNKKEAGSKYGW